MGSRRIQYLEKVLQVRIRGPRHVAVRNFGKYTMKHGNCREPDLRLAEASCRNSESIVPRP